MDEKEIKSLIEHTFRNTGQKPAMLEMTEDGKQYITALVDIVKTVIKNFHTLQHLEFVKISLNLQAQQTHLEEQS